MPPFNADCLVLGYSRSRISSSEKCISLIFSGMVDSFSASFEADATVLDVMQAVAVALKIELGSFWLSSGSKFISPSCSGQSPGGFASLLASPLVHRRIEHLGLRSGSRVDIRLPLRGGGVPAFFRWLVKRYPESIKSAYIDTPGTERTHPGFVVGDDVCPDNVGHFDPRMDDLEARSPNCFETDCFYVDMNGLIHPCCHPQEGSSPKSEVEMVWRLFAMLDNLIATVRPRKLVYFAIDGVAPRAKMNQQRCRRFKTALDIANSEAAAETARTAISEEGLADLLPPKKEARWDWNAITPGTPFMELVSLGLKWYIRERQARSKYWRSLFIVFSDSNEPGEGEHKIAAYIRLARLQAGYNPLTTHVVCGLDADHIFLALATHEVRFKVIRDHVDPRNPSVTGRPREDRVSGLSNYDYLDIGLVRQYLMIDFAMVLARGADPERVVVDYVVLCFFVGNDFLPHIPFVEISASVLDLLLWWYTAIFLEACDPEQASLHRQRSRSSQPSSNGGPVPESAYLVTSKGQLNLVALRAIFGKLAKAVNALMKADNDHKTILARRYGDADAEKRDEREKFLAEAKANLKELVNGGDASPESIKCYYDSMMAYMTESREDVSQFSPADGGVRWADEGYRARYYIRKFGAADPKNKHASKDGTSAAPALDASGRHLTVDEVAEKAVHEYLRGMQWVLQYYTIGTPDWAWFYPFYYAPLAEDFFTFCPTPQEATSSKLLEFDLHEPFTPFEQLLAVLPTQSWHAVPKEFRVLKDQSSSLFPDDFDVDYEGKKRSYQGVVLLPFLAEEKFLEVVRPLQKAIMDKGGNAAALNAPRSALLHASGPLLAKSVKNIQDAAEDTAQSSKRKSRDDFFDSSEDDRPAKLRERADRSGAAVDTSFSIGTWPDLTFSPIRNILGCVDSAPPTEIAVRYGGAVFGRASLPKDEVDAPGVPPEQGETSVGKREVRLVYRCPAKKANFDLLFNPVTIALTFRHPVGQGYSWRLLTSKPNYLEKLADTDRTMQKERIKCIRYLSEDLRPPLPSMTFGSDGDSTGSPRGSYGGRGRGGQIHISTTTSHTHVMHAHTAAVNSQGYAYHPQPVMHRMPPNFQVSSQVSAQYPTQPYFRQPQPQAQYHQQTQYTAGVQYSHVQYPPQVHYAQPPQPQRHVQAPAPAAPRFSAANVLPRGARMPNMSGALPTKHANKYRKS